MTYWTVDDFLDHNFPEIEYVIDPIFPVGGLFLLHGQQTTGKSQLALGVLRAASEGGLLLRQFPVAKMRSLYVQFDLPEKLFQDRIMAVSKFVRSGDIGIVTKYGYHDVPRWTNPKHTPDDIKRAQDSEPQLVVIDSLRRCHKLDENDSATVTQVYGAWQELFPEASIMPLHHESKDQPGQTFKRSSASKPRGSSAWIDDADGAMGIERVGRGRGGQHKARLTFTKIYTAEEPEPIDVVMDPDLLMLEPTSLTTRQYAEMFVRDNPEATKHQLAIYLMELKNDKGEDLCGQSNAYKVARSVLESGQFYTIPPGGGKS